MIDILLPENMAKHDTSKAPGMQNPMVSMGGKYAHVEEALRLRYPDVRRVFDVDDIDANLVIVDPVWFRPPHHTANERLEHLERFLRKGFSRVMLYCSDASLMVMPDRLRRQLIPAVNWVTHNSIYQQHALRTRGIYHSEFLCDPIPGIFSPSRKEKRVYMAGQINWEKRTADLIRIYDALRYTDFETVYLGSATLWGEQQAEAEMSTRFRLQSELREVCDVFVGNAHASEVAQWANSSAHHVMVSQHDCCSQAQQEAALSGCVLWGLSHPLNAERPVYQFASPDELVGALIDMDLVSLDSRSRQVRQHALERWSYEAFLTQFENILRRM